MTITGVGPVVVPASQAGNGNYNAAAPVDRSFTVAAGAQTITFGALTNKTYGDAPFSVSATASSGLTVSFGIASGPATLVGNTVTITGARHGRRAGVAGRQRQLQRGDAVDQSFTVNKATPTITWNNPANINSGTALGATQFNATASTAGTFLYTPAAGTVSVRATANNCTSTSRRLTRRTTTAVRRTC